jgi:hypothetical protein
MPTHFGLGTLRRTATGWPPPERLLQRRTARRICMSVAKIIELVASSKIAFGIEDAEGA